jgi:hypothetical protein
MPDMRIPKIVYPPGLGFAFWYYMSLPATGANVNWIKFWLVAWVALAAFAVIRSIRKWPSIVFLPSSVMVVLLATDLALFAWPQTRAELIAELGQMVRRQAWPELGGRLMNIEANPSLRDVTLHFRGALLMNMRPMQQDPEQFLSMVPPDSDLYYSAQILRLENWAQSPVQVSLAASIADSMERANARYAMYYRFRLVNPTLTYTDVQTLYTDFRQRHASTFDFNQMKHVIQLTVGRPIAFSLEEATRVEAATVLFLVRLMETAHAACRADDMKAALTSYEMLRKQDDNDFAFELRSLKISPAILRVPATINVQPFPVCRGPLR